jgi:hypothetical protein
MVRGLLIDRRQTLFLGICIGAFLFSSMAFLLRYPFGCSAHIRYVMGILIPASILTGKGLESLPVGWISRMFKLLVLFFVWATTVHFLLFIHLWL